MSQPTPETKTVLILGANGRTGVELIRSASNLPTKPAVHAFVRTPSKLASTDTSLCAGVHKGDATHQADLQRVIDACKPDTIIVALGVRNLGRCTMHADSAKALFEVVKPGSAYENVRVVVISGIGVGDSEMKIGMGLGYLMSLTLKNIINDHTNQENILREGFGTQHGKRLLIVRPTLLKSGKPTGKVATVRPGEKQPTIRIDRGDVAQYIWQQLMGDGPSFGSTVCITTAK